MLEAQDDSGVLFLLFLVVHTFFRHENGESYQTPFGKKDGLPIV